MDDNGAACIFCDGAGEHPLLSKLDLAALQGTHPEPVVRAAARESRLLRDENERLQEALHAFAKKWGAQYEAMESDRDAWKRTAKIRAALLEGDDKPFRAEIAAAESGRNRACELLTDALTILRAHEHGSTSLESDIAAFLASDDTAGGPQP